MKIRFLADADLNRSIVNGVLRREPSIDFITAHDAGLRRLKDPEILAFAADRRCVLVSHDAGTMPAHFRAFQKAGNYSAGVFLVSQSLDIATAIDELLMIWLALEAPDGKTGWHGYLSDLC